MCLVNKSSAVTVTAGNNERNVAMRETISNGMLAIAGWLESLAVKVKPETIEVVSSTASYLF